MTIIDKSNPFPAKIKERSLLNKAGSTKQTYHLVLDIKGSNLTFKPGDSIGVIPQNAPERVADALRTLNANPEDPIVDPRSQQSMTMLEYLTHKVNLARLPAFAPLLPRFYSVASSPNTHPDEIHLLVALLQGGVASPFLCQAAELESTPIPIYLQPAHTFFLPQNPETHIIMIGPGTGIAPFRAFMQDRLHTQSPGKNWLFFGERNRASDFFYEDFWTALAAENRLRLDLAFSRDQEEKCYVQHQMYQQSKELWDWIQEGAHIYVCGDKEKMAKDVDATLQKIAVEQGNLSPEDARLYVRGLRTQKRYLLDVY